MTVAAPQARIGAEYPLGYATQSALGTPTTTMTDWLNQTANTLNPITGEHMIDTAMGTRATEQESAQGETRVEGGFECNLRTSTTRSLIKALLGGTPDTSTAPGYVIIPVGRPLWLTLYDCWADEAHQYQDCVLGSAVFSCANHLEWHAAFTVLGGLETLVDTQSPNVPTGDHTLAWADVVSITNMQAVAGQISQWSFTVNNNPKQDYGAGQHAATSTIGGKFQVDGSAMIRYDDANAAAVHAAYKSGADLGPTTLTIGDTGTQATGTSALTSTAVSSVTVTNGGTGYNSGATVSFSGGGGSGAAGTPVVSNGVIVSVTITSGGTGYTTPPTVTFSAPPGNRHVVYFPNITLLTCSPQKPIDDFHRLSVTFGCKHAENFTWKMPSS